MVNMIALTISVLEGRRARLQTANTEIQHPKYLRTFATYGQQYGRSARHKAMG
jgi:hypothetical protein